MAPPKKSTASTSKPAQQQQIKTKTSRKRTLDSVDADDLDASIPTTHSSPSPRSSDPSAPSSQGASAASPSGDRLALLMEKMVSDQRKRHTTRTTTLQAAYDTHVRSTRAAVDEVLDVYERDAEQAHRAQTTRLTKLLASKAEFEAQMARKAREMRDLYVQQAETMRVVLERRGKLLG